MSDPCCRLWKQLNSLGVKEIVLYFLFFHTECYLVVMGCYCTCFIPKKDDAFLWVPHMGGVHNFNQERTWYWPLEDFSDLPDIPKPIDKLYLLVLPQDPIRVQIIKKKREENINHMHHAKLHQKKKGYLFWFYLFYLLFYFNYCRW